MGFGGDERGVTVQIGAVLLLGIVVLSLSVYQVTVVPSANEQVEFQHSQTVQGDLVELRNGLLEAAAADTARPVSVRLGVEYPPRTLFVNPPPATGRLSTESAGQLVVANAEATAPEADDYWDGANQSFATNRLVYHPNYHEYSNAPVTVTEDTVVYNRFDNGANLTLTGQTLVDGRQLLLVVVDGNLSKQGTRPTAVDLQPKSPATRSVSVTETDGTGENVTLVVPTALSADTWRELLEESGQLDGTGDATNDAYVHSVESAGANAVRVTLEADVTYELRVAKVGVGTGASEPGAHYVVGQPNDVADVPETGTRELVVEVRDRYDNPVAGATVNATLADGGGSIAAQEQSGYLDNLTTDDEGQVRITYEAPAVGSTESVRVDASYDADPRTGFDATTRQDTSFEFAVYDTDGTSGSGGDGGGGTSADAVVYDGNPEATTSEVQFKIKNDGTQDVTIAGFAVKTNRASQFGTFKLGSQSLATGKFKTNGQNNTVDTKGTLTPGESQFVNFEAFNNDVSDSSFDRVDSESNSEFTVRLVFEDGSAKELYFN